MLSAFGHNPTIAIPDFEGEVKWSSSTLEDASVRIVIKAGSLVVTGDISRKDRQEIEQRMHDEVLETDGFPEIVYECPRVSSIQKIGEGLFSVSLNGRIVFARSDAESAGFRAGNAERRHFARRRRIFRAPE